MINEAISVLMGKQRFAREEAYEVADALMKLVAVPPRDEDDYPPAACLRPGAQLGTNRFPRRPKNNFHRSYR